LYKAYSQSQRHVNINLFCKLCGLDPIDLWEADRKYDQAVNEVAIAQQNLADFLPEAFNEGIVRRVVSRHLLSAHSSL